MDAIPWTKVFILTSSNSEYKLNKMPSISISCISIKNKKEKKERRKRTRECSEQSLTLKIDV